MSGKVLEFSGKIKVGETRLTVKQIDFTKTLNLKGDEQKTLSQNFPVNIIIKNKTPTFILENVTETIKALKEMKRKSLKKQTYKLFQKMHVHRNRNYPHSLMPKM